MKYNLATPTEVDRAKEYFERLIEKKSVVEIKKVSGRRSLPQNNYLHLLLNAFGLHFGYTLPESKVIYKELNSDIYAYTKSGRTFYKSSADLTKDEMMKTIDRFRDASADQGYPLPLATDEAWLREIDNAIEQARHFL